MEAHALDGAPASTLTSKAGAEMGDLQMAPGDVGEALPVLAMGQSSLPQLLLGNTSIFTQLPAFFLPYNGVCVALAR